MTTWQQQLSAELNGGRAEQALLVAAAAETLGAPVAADGMLTDRVLLHPENAITTTLAATLGSVLAGGIIYVVGFALAALGGMALLSALGLGNLVAAMQLGMQAYAAFLVMAAGVATIPFALLLFLAGFLGAPPLYLFPAALVARGLRYGLMSWLLWRGGLHYRDWLGRYYHGLTLVVALGLLLLGVFIVLLKFTQRGGV